MKNSLLKLSGFLFSLMALALAMFNGAAYGQSALPQGEPESMGMSAARFAVLDAGIQAEVDKGSIAGVVVAVARHGQMVHNKAYGYANIEEKYDDVLSVTAFENLEIEKQIELFIDINFL